MPNQPVAPARPRSVTRSWLQSVSAAVVVLGVAAACAGGSAGSAATPGPEVPAVGDPTPASCPAMWTNDRPTPTRSSGPFVPKRAAEALLCSYPVTDTPTQPVGDVHRITADVDQLIDYLNGLPEAVKSSTLCPLDKRTEHIIAFGYPDRPPAVVHLRQCSLDQSGQVRYEGDIKKITGFWGVEWNK